MNPVSQLLIRNLSGIRPGSAVCWVNPMADEAWSSLESRAGKLSLWCQDYRDRTWLSNAGANARFCDFPPMEEISANHFILSLPRSKQKLDMMLGFIQSAMSPGGRLWLVGENRAGIKSAKTLLEKWFGKVTLLDNARHCGLFEASQALNNTPFRLEDYALNWQLDEEFNHLAIRSWPGVFAHGKLDEGTRMLLSQLAGLDSGKSALDFGCGCGVISALLGSLHPDMKITMTDIDALALRAARETMNLNGLRADIRPVDGLEDLEQRFDLVVTNPPFHQGHRTSSTMSMQMLAPLRNFLNPRGQLLMVVNRHLPYRKWLDGIFDRHVVLASNSRFQVLHAVQAGRKT